MAKKVLIIRYNCNDYFFKNVAKKYNVVSTFDNPIEYKYFKLMTKINADMPLLFGGWKHHIREYDKVIIFDYGWSKEITNYIKKNNSKIKIHLFFFNTISNQNHKMILKDKNIDKIWSFDPQDVKKYGLYFNTPMYAKEYVEQLLPISCVKNDIVFVGKAKEREELILKIESFCKNAGLKTDFTIVKNENDYVTYNDYMKKVLNSRCILDITNKGQTGLTLRFMEALFFKKKIITNNSSVKKYDFYDERNILVIDNDNISRIEEFLNTPFYKISDEQINYFALEEWIGRFI